MIQHAKTSLPWSVRIGSGLESEQTHLHDMLEELPPKTLLSDAGFFSYGLASTLISKEHAFLLRVGGNVTLIQELFEDADVVYGNQEASVWPNKRQQRGEPPLRLRIIRIRTRHRHTPDVYLVTNLPTSILSDRRARELYRLRWGNETLFRTAKQIFEREKFNCRTPEMVVAEAHWLCLSLLLLGALTQDTRGKRDRSKGDWSPSLALKQVRRRLYYQDRASGWDCSWKVALRGCVIDRGERKSLKSPRRHPRKKVQKPPNPPKRRLAKAAEKRLAKQLNVNKLPNQFTA